MYHFEILVCGGGPAGITAAVAAAESGCKTLLVERLGRLGGMGTNGLVNQFRIDKAPPVVQSLLGQISGHENDAEFLDLLYAERLLDSGSELLLHTTVCDVLKTSGDASSDQVETTLSGVRLMSPKGPVDITADRVIDATGDGNAAFLAGAGFDMGREPDGLMQPTTIMFRVSGVEPEVGRPAEWDKTTMAGMKRGELPKNVGKVRMYFADRENDRYVNATQTNGIDATDIFDLTKAEIDGRRQVPVVMEFLRRYAPGYENAYVSQMPAVVGVRETRRFRGLVTLTREDCLSGRKWADAVVTDCRASLDVHNPEGPGQAEGVSEDHPAGTDPVPEPYDIPFGCLVPESVDGLLLSGRCISGDHHAHSSYRRQWLCMGIGAASGFAAAESLSQKVQPRYLDVQPVQQKLGIER